LKLASGSSRRKTLQHTLVPFKCFEIRNLISNNKRGWVKMENNVSKKKSQMASDSNKCEITYYTKPWLIERINRILDDLDRSLDITTLRILGFFFDEKGHTKAQITLKLKLWEKLIDEKLKWLKKQGFIRDKRMTFGIDIYWGRRTIYVYYITELGRFLLHYLDMQFPGLWMTIKEMEAKNCKYSK